MGAYKLLINGEMVDGDLSMDVLNPATEEKIADCPRASESQLNAAVAAAKAAFPVWSKTSVDERKALVLKIADVIEANATELVQLLT
jgi:acyl-CoA reductase-like NAD-dependent aldehyde dehydrogenase